MATLAHLRALHTKIGAALDDVEGAYTARGVDFPSLDVAVCHDDNNPAAASEGEKLRMDPSVSRSLETIVAACGELSTSAKSPFYHLIDALTAVFHSSTVVVNATLIIPCRRT